MKKRLVLHIGMPKTGTTTIQKTLAHNDRALARRGVLYPEFGRCQDGHHLVVDPLVDAIAPFALAPALAPREVVAKILSWGTGRSQQTIILSSENFAAARGIRPVLHEIAEAFDLQIVLVFRAQLAYANSMLNQRLKMRLFGRHESLEACLAKVGRKTNYLKIARLWRDALPGARLSLTVINENEDAWSAFARTVDPVLEEIEPARSRSNPSLPPEALAFIDWLLTTPLKDNFAERGRVLESLESYSAHQRERVPFTLIDPDSEQQIRADAEMVNQILSQEFFGGRPLFGETKHLPYVDIRSIGSDRILEVAGYVLGKYQERADARRDGRESLLARAIGTISGAVPTMRGKG